MSEAPSPRTGEAGDNASSSRNQGVGDAAGAAPSPNSPHVADAAGAATAHVVGAAGAASTNTTYSWRAPWPFGSWWRSLRAGAAGAATAPNSSHTVVDEAALSQSAVSQFRAELATAHGASPQIGEAGGNASLPRNRGVGDAAGAAPSPTPPHVADAAEAATAHAACAAGAAPITTTTSWRAWARTLRLFPWGYASA